MEPSFLPLTDIGHWYTIQTININFFSILFVILLSLLLLPKKKMTIQIAKKKEDESTLRSHSTLEMIVSVYHVNSLKWKSQIILCGGTKYLAFLPQIVYCFWFPKECWYVALNVALIRWIPYQRVSSPLEQRSLSDLSTNWYNPRERLLLKLK